MVSSCSYVKVDNKERKVGGLCSQFKLKLNLLTNMRVEVQVKEKGKEKNV